MSHQSSMKIRFYIHNRETASGERLIFCDYRHSGRYRFSTGIAIIPQYWNEAKQRAKPKHQHARNININLDAIENRLSSIAYELIRDRKEPRPEVVKRLYESGKRDELSIWDAWDRFEKEYVRLLELNTRNNYSQSANRWREFEVHEGIELFFSDMNESMIRRYIALLFREFPLCARLKPWNQGR